MIVRARRQAPVATYHFAVFVLTLLFETHSWSEDNERGIATGWLPGALSTRGRELAREMGARHRDSNLAAVFTSDLGRAVETATIAFSSSAIPILKDARLRECDFGDLNGRPVALHEGRRATFTERPYPNGQSYRQVQEQVRSFLLDLMRDYEGQTVLAIGHAATRWSLDALLLGRPLERSVDAPFNWQPGWTYRLTADHLRRLASTSS